MQIKDGNMKRLPIYLALCAILFVCSGCDTRRKIQIYDLNNRKVVAILDNVFSESNGREIFENNFDFKSKTFATCQRMAGQKMTVLRQYAFDGEVLSCWNIPETIYHDHNFSIRNNHFFYTDSFRAFADEYKKYLMVCQLSALASPKVILSPNPLIQSLASCQDPPFIFLRDDTLLCLVEQDEDDRMLQLWKITLEGDKTLLPERVDRLSMNNCLSSDFSGMYHAVQLNRHDVLFFDSEANRVAQLSVDFPICRTWWDENHLYWVYDFLGGAYLCYDVGERQIVKQGSLTEGNDVYVGPFFDGQYVVIKKRLFMGFFRTTIQDLSGNHIATLPWMTSRVFYLGDGQLLIEEQ